MTDQVPTEISPDVQARIDTFTATPEEAGQALAVLMAKHRAEQAAARNEVETAAHMVRGMEKSEAFQARFNAGDVAALAAWKEAVNRAAAIDDQGNPVAGAEPAEPPMFESIGPNQLPHFAKQHLGDDLRRRGLSEEDVLTALGDGAFGDEDFITPHEQARARMALAVRDGDPERVRRYLAGDVVEGAFALEVAKRLAATVVSDPAELQRLRGIREAWRAGRRT